MKKPPCSLETSLSAARRPGVPSPRQAGFMQALKVLLQSLLGWTAAALWLLCGSALAQVTIITGGSASTPRMSTTAQGVEMLVGGADQAVNAAEQDAPATANAKRRGPVINDDRLVSQQLVAMPGQPAVMRPAHPRTAPSRADERVEILTQELARESKDLHAKQRLLELPHGKDPMTDGLRERIQDEVKRHEQSLVGLRREIDRVVRESRARLSSAVN